MTNNEGEHMNTDTDKPAKGDIYDRTDGTAWCVVLDDTDHGNDVLVELHWSDGPINRFDTPLAPRYWRKRPKRPAVPQVDSGPYRYVDRNGGTWVTHEHRHPIIRIDMRDGSAVWLPDETPLTDDERKQLWGDS